MIEYIDGKKIITTSCGSVATYTIEHIEFLRANIEKRIIRLTAQKENMDNQIVLMQASLDIQ